MNNVPNWIWFLIALLVILGILTLIGVNIEVDA